MKKYINYLGLCLLLCASCITEVDFASEESQFVAINGVISNSPTERVLTFFQNVNTSAGIDANLYKNDVLETQLQVGRKGELLTMTIPDGVQIEEGASYHIEVITESGDVYMSEPQLVVKGKKPQALSTIMDQQLFQELGGDYTEKNFINVEVDYPVSDQDDPLFMRFQIDESWAYQEVDDPRKSGDPMFLCYIERGVSTFPTKVWSTGGLSPGVQTFRVASRVVDESFLLKHYLNVYTYQINEKAYNYYRNAQKIVENTGTLVDEIPAALEGNIYNANDEKELVFGFVEFGIPDTSRIFVNGINTRLENPCDIPEPCLPPVAAPGGLPPFFPFCPCADCLLISGATLEKPPYF